MKRSYKEFDRVFLGFSDIAGLVARGYDNLQVIRFGGDGSYHAYLCEDAEIGDHYSKVFECETWLKIYDDREKTLEVYGKVIEIWRAGDYGMIINVKNGDK